MTVEQLIARGYSAKRISELTGERIEIVGIAKLCWQTDDIPRLSDVRQRQRYDQAPSLRRLGTVKSAPTKKRRDGQGEVEAAAGRQQGESRDR